MRWLVLATLAACVDPSAVPCGDGDLCPAGTVCASVTNPDEKLCAQPEQIADCANKPDYTHCLSDGRCYDGVCLPVRCGNGRVDRADPNDPMDVGEACDDTNQTAGDGCSADCKSTEVCGNGYLDAIKGELCDDGNLVDHDACTSRCRPEEPKWTQLVQGPPSQRGSAATAYDSDRGVVVMFGGFDAATATWLDETWIWNGVGWTLVPVAERPPARSAAAMAYDPTRQVMVLYGGSGASGTLADTWEFDGKRWRPAVSAMDPRRRAGHVMAYDSARKRVVLFGGLVENPSNFLGSDETWEWTTAGWVLIEPTAKPFTARSTAMAYDPTRGVLVIFGDVGTSTDVFEYDGTTWRDISPSGQRPPQRRAHSLAWDPISKRVILFGGADINAIDLGDTWAWNGQVWTPLTPSASPAARSGHFAVTDPVRGRIVLWGGTATDPDTWEWDGTTWLDIASAAPPRGRLPVAYNTNEGHGSLVDSASIVWNLRGTAWQKTTPLGIATADISSAVAYDAAHDKIVLFGGGSGDTRTWLWDGIGWKPVTTPGPSARTDAAMTYDAGRQRIVLFGGYTGSTFLDDTWEWDGATWTQMMTSPHPTGRASAAIGYDPLRHVTVLFGGDDSSGMLQRETWTWDGTSWTPHTVANGPVPRTSGKMTWHGERRRMVLFGGYTNTWTNDTWEWDGTTWTNVPIALVPSPRLGAALTPTQGGIALYGGVYGLSIGFTKLADTWRLRWESDNTEEACRDAVDRDGDGLVGCDDQDCWQVCTPLCPPGSDPSCAGPHCGDGVCSPVENCRICPTDCTCTATCGDLYCDPAETLASCPGDCTP